MAVIALHVFATACLGGAAARSACTITPQSGTARAANPLLFGLNDVLGPIINLTYVDRLCRSIATQFCKTDELQMACMHAVASGCSA
jgi:hypothetical protein